MASFAWSTTNRMISNDPTPMAKVFRKVMNPIHSPTVSLSLRERREVAESNIPRIRLHWYANGCMFKKRMKGHLRLYRGEGDGETLPEWLRGKGDGETPKVYNNTL